MARILTADAHREFCALLGFALARAGHTQIVAQDGGEAVALAHSEAPDLVLLGTEISGMNGFEAAGTIRQTSAVPIILLSERGSEEDQLEGFNRGADEYVVKPFSMLVLMKRIEALLRRTMPQPDGYAAGAEAGAAGADGRSYSLAGAAFYPDRHEVIGTNGRRYHLTPKEGRLLTTLLRHRAHVLSVSTLLARVWGYDTNESTVLVKTHIYHLRRKLQAATGGRKLIRTVPGAGYLLDGDD
jgi:two-component system alkaline phosphatase synthesis response regulator PhoP